MFYGSALGGQQQVCPFPEEWQFQTIPESIENNEEIDWDISINHKHVIQNL